MPISFRDVEVKKIVQVHLPIVISSSVQQTINTHKVLKYYERLCAYTYSKYIVALLRSSIGEKLSIALRRYGPLFMTIASLLSPAILFLIYKRSGMSSGEAYARTVTGKFPESRRMLKESEEGSDRKGSKLDITEFVVDPRSLVIQYIAHIAEDKFYTSTKEIISGSMIKNAKQLATTIDVIQATPGTDIELLVLNIPCYVINVSEIEELSDVLTSRLCNKIVIDFTTDVVEVELVTINNRKVRYVTTIKDVLLKPDINTISLSDLVGLLKGTQKE